MMGGGREGEDTLHDGGWEGGRGDHAHSSWECMEEVGGETRKGRGRGEDGRGEGRVWGRSACGTVCRASHWEGVRGREKGEGEGGRGTGSERGQHSVREHRRRQSQKYHAALGHLLAVPV